MKRKQTVFLTTVVFVILAIVILVFNRNHGLYIAEPQEITVWTYYNGAQLVAFENLVNEFNNTVGEKEGIVVTSESKSTVDELIQSVNESARESVGAEPMPDIFQCYRDMAAQMDQSMLVNLDDYVSAVDKKQYISEYIAEGTLGADQEWKLFPVAKSTEVLMVNKTEWEKFAAVKAVTTSELQTWEGMAKVAKLYYEWSGKSFFGRDAFANYMLVGSSQLGCEIFEIQDQTALVKLDKNVMRRLWDNFYIPYIRGYYSHIGRYRSDDIKLGTIIAEVCSSSSAPYFPEEITDENGEVSQIDCLVLPAPQFENTQPCYVQQGASMAVTKTNKFKERASVEFLKWLTESDRNMGFGIQAGYLPVKAEANTKDNLLKVCNKTDGVSEVIKETMEVAMEQVDSGSLYVMPQFLGSGHARDFLADSMLELAVSDRASIESKIANGTSESEALSEFITKEHFDNWYTDLKRQLEDICASEKASNKNTEG